MHVACDLKTQNTVLHIMHFLRPRVAKAPCTVWESTDNSNSTVTPTFLYFIKSFTFFMLLCTCSIHLWLFSFFLLLYFSKAASFKKRHSDQKNRPDQVHLLKRSAFHWRNTEVFFCCVLWVTLDYLYTYEAKHNIELLIPGLRLPLRKAVSSS